jgi:hypothetical protein
MTGFALLKAREMIPTPSVVENVDFSFSFN